MNLQWRIFFYFIVYKGVLTHARKCQSFIIDKYCDYVFYLLEETEDHVFLKMMLYGAPRNLVEMYSATFLCWMLLDMGS